MRSYTLNGVEQLLRVRKGKDNALYDRSNGIKKDILELLGFYPFAIYPTTVVQLLSLRTPQIM
jgi:hypothetical protein